MPLSTVKRESLIPRLHMLSIAAVLTLAFIVLKPSSEIFIYSTAEDTNDTDIGDIDLAYLKAREASGDLDEQEVKTVIHDLIRSKKWEQARSVMAQKPDIDLDPRDQFLLDLETASAGFYAAESEASSASYQANLVGLMNDLYITPVLHDEGTLTRAAQFSADLGQPILSARYYKLMATHYPDKDTDLLLECAQVLRNFKLYGDAAECYESAIASTDDTSRKSNIYLRLGRLHLNSGDTLAATASLESLVKTVPSDKTLLERTAAFALENGRPELAYPLYASLADIEKEKAVFWFEKAAKWSEASNLPGLAAEYVLSIRDLSDEQYYSELTRRRQALLIAAGRNEEALNTMYERIAANPNSGEELIEGIALADSMGLTQQASEWNESLLALRPFDIEAMTRQVTYALASKRLEEGLAWSKRILEQEPLDPANRLLLAQLEEWTGNVNAATAQRKWLADNQPTVDNNRELLRLAELNWDSRTAAEALRNISKTKALSAEELVKLVELYEQDGSPQLAASALDEMMGSGNDALLLREKASLHARHLNYPEALASWEQFAQRFGRSAEESLNRMELLWRMNRPEEALALTDQITQFNTNAASQYQLALLTELGWRYRQPELVFAAAPYLDELDPEVYTTETGRRIVQSLVDAGDFEQAVQTAENLWRQTDELSFLLSAMDIALKENIYPHYERFLDANGDLIKVREIPEYWLTVADHHNRVADTDAAIETYRNTLASHPNNVDAATGLIWSLLGADTNDATILATLDQLEPLATNSPELWSPFAVGLLRANDPGASLRWFSKIMVQDDHDYNVLLSFADALEQTGNAPHAFKVRQYAIKDLLPQVMAVASNKIDDIGRDYISLLRTYGSAAENEAWTQKLLDGIDESSPEESAWRRELAASWYLATQRHDYARLVMTKTHERRLQSPVWQRLAVAMNDNNLPVVREILASSRSELSAGDQIAALRKIGNEQQAYILAGELNESAVSAAENRIAQENLISIRGSRPGYYSSQVTQRLIGDLNVTESGLSLRHTLQAADLGFGVDYQRNTLRSDEPQLANADEDNLEISAHFGNSSRGGRLVAGVNSNGNDDLTYTGGEYYVRGADGKRELTSEFGLNEVPDAGANFRLTAKQDRAQLAYTQSIGGEEFVKFSGRVNEISTRDTDDTIGRTIDATVELGTTGSFGSNNWTMGVLASGNKNDFAATNNFGAIDENTQQVAVSASLFRGGIRSNFPQTASPRYSLSASVGLNWPSESTALQLQAGAGFRVLGNDELSFQFQHDRQVEQFVDDQLNSSVGIQYRNHF